MREEKLLMTVEIPQGRSNKYEFNKDTQQWELDRVLPGAMIYPVEYGYFQQNLGDDGGSRRCNLLNWEIYFSYSC